MKNSKWLISGLAFATASQLCYGQNTDVSSVVLEAAPSSANSAIGNSAPNLLVLGELFEGVMASHPGLKATKFQATAALEDVTATERLRLPTLSVTTETTSQSNNAAFAPTRMFRAEQTLWDFGRISAKIEEFNASALVADTVVEQTKQDLFLQVVNAWNQLGSALEKEKVALRALGLLRGFQAQMNRRVQAQASPQIDLELVNARILQTEVELTSMRTQISQSVTRLEQLSGLKNLSARLNIVKTAPTPLEIEGLASAIERTDWNGVSQAHISVKKAQQDQEILKQRLASKLAELKPQVYFRVDKPLDTTSSVTSTKPSYFVGLRYTPSTGFAGQAEAKAMSTRIKGQELSIETAEREILQTLLNDRDEFLNSRLRYVALKKSVTGANVVLESYLRQFQAGRKSWLDLLNAARELAQNEYAQVDALGAISVTMNRLKLRMGLRLD